MTERRKRVDDREKEARKSAAHWELIQRLVQDPELLETAMTPGQEQLHRELQAAWMVHQRAFYEWKAMYYGQEVDERQMYLDAQEEVAGPEPDPSDEEAYARRFRAEAFLQSVDIFSNALDANMAELNFNLSDESP